MLNIYVDHARFLFMLKLREADDYLPLAENQVLQASDLFPERVLCLSQLCQLAVALRKTD